MRSELDPEAEELLARAAEKNRPSAHQLAVESIRRLNDEVMKEVGVLDDPEPVGEVTEFSIPGRDDESIPLRVYIPDGEGPFPVLVWYHGGGWVRGTLDSTDSKCRFLARRAECSIVSVDYRLAPEHRFPSGLLDAYTAAKWVTENAEVADSDGAPVAVGGVSSGANLAAAVAIMARDLDELDLRFQFLGSPVTNFGFDTDSYRENGSGYGLTKADMEYFWDQYLSGPIDGYHPYASPAKARDLSDLPPALIVTGGFDPLRDDGKMYADRLQEAGVPVEHANYEDMPHGVMSFKFLDRDVERTTEAFEDVAAGLRNAFEDVV